MRHHRWFRILALLVPLALLVAACGDDDDDTTTGGAHGGGDAAEAIQVRLVYDLGGRGDESFNDAAAAGLDRAEADLDVEAQELELDEGGENRDELLRLLANRGSGLIFGVGFLFTDSITAVAPDFPDTTFAIIDSVVEADNVASLTFAEHEGSFLVGAAAALTSETGKIGFIGGVEVDLIKKFEAGYVAGATHVNPAIEVDISYLSQPPDFSSDDDPALGKEIAAAQYGAGADVIYAAADGSGGGVFDAAREASSAGTKAWGIGVDSDQYNAVGESLQPYVLTSMLKMVDLAVYDTIKAFGEGEEVGGRVTEFGLAAGGVDYSTTGGHLAEDVVEQLEVLKQEIIDGSIEVPATA